MIYNVAKSVLAAGGLEFRKRKSNDIGLQKQLSSADANVLSDGVFLDDTLTKETFNDNFVFEFCDMHSQALNYQQQNEMC